MAPLGECIAHSDDAPLGRRAGRFPEAVRGTNIHPAWGIRKRARMQSLSTKMLMAAGAVVMFSTVTAIAGAQGLPRTAGPSVCVPRRRPRVSRSATALRRAVPARARSARSARFPCASTGVWCCRCRCDSGRLNCDVRRVLDRARVPGH